ncbi:chemotaxis-specific methylesterase domain protein, partial [Vibrio cholerae O1 str. EDC-020]
RSWLSDELAAIDVVGAGRGAAGRRRNIFFDAIESTRCCNSVTASSRLRAISSNFLGKKSNAPASSASNVAFAPSWVNEENIKMGTGLFAMISRTAEIPSMTGISISIVITSGLSRAAFSTASFPFTATSMTSKRDSELMISLTRRRKKLESSTTNTLIAMFILIVVQLIRREKQLHTA